MAFSTKTLILECFSSDDPSPDVTWSLRYEVGMSCQLLSALVFHYAVIQIRVEVNTLVVQETDTVICVKSCGAMDIPEE